MKHKYLRELFPDGNLPFPYSEPNYHKFDQRDTYSMDVTFAAWMYECLRFFQDEASKIINFDFYKYKIDGTELTQRQCIDRMVKDCAFILKNNDQYKDAIKLVEAKDDLFKVFSAVYWQMWW